MATRQKDLRSPPLFRPGDFIRMVSLLVAAGFILWAMVKASDPRTWHWVAALQRRPAAAKIESPPNVPPMPASDASILELQIAAGRAGGLLAQFTVPTLTPASLDAGVLGVLANEYVPLPAEVKQVPVRATRQAPSPERRWLAGAIDHEVFLHEDETSGPADPNRRDADARYHLLALANEATPAQLAADARSHIRFSALLEKPRDYRGEVVHIQGDLMWVQTFELQRPTPGLEFVYQGLIVVPSTGQSYGILFTELPQHLPPERLWNRLYLRDAAFDGYFLKVLKVAVPADKNHPARTGFIPVLVGKSPVLPAPPPPFDLVGTLKTLGVILGALLVLGTLALWLYRRSERRYLAKMAEVRARALGRSPELPTSDGPTPAAEGFEGFMTGGNAEAETRPAGPPEPSES